MRRTTWLYCIFLVLIALWLQFYQFGGEAPVFLAEEGATSIEERRADSKISSGGPVDASELRHAARRPPQRLTLQFVNSSDELVPNVRIDLKDEHASDNTVWHSSRQGIAHITLPGPSPSVLEFSARHYKTQEFVWIPDKHRDQAVEIQLWRNDVIRGALRHPHGDSCNGGELVVVWPEGESPPTFREIFEHAPDASERFKTAVVDSNGEFAVGELQPDRTYTVTCGGNACLLARRLTEIVADEEAPVLLEPLWGYSLNVRVVGLDGTTFPITPAYCMTRPGTARVPAAEGRGYSTRPTLELDLATGTDLSLAPTDAIHRSWYFVSSHRRESIGPVHFQDTILGAGPVSAHIDAYLLPNAESVSMRHDAPIVKSSRLDVVFEMGVDVCRETSTSLGWGEVRLRDANGVSWVLPISRCTERVTFEPIPVGTYKIFFKPTNGSMAFEPIGGTSRQLGPAGDEVVFRLQVAGGVSARLDYNGRPYTGSANLAAIRTDIPSRSVRRVFFDKAPYCVDCLEPGEYMIRCDSPGRAVEQDVLVRAGEITGLSLSLKEGELVDRMERLRLRGATEVVPLRQK